MSIRRGGATLPSQPVSEPTPTCSAAVIDATRLWLERAVIGLNLCPFARGVHARGQIRWQVSLATEPDALREDLAAELRWLHAADPAQVDTTLLIAPDALPDFLDFNDFLDVADATLASLGLVGEIQIASFHPAYRFAGTAADDITNHTNRSPFPTLHLLRESSIERAVAGAPDADAIVERNLRTLQALGMQGWHALWRDLGT